MRNVLNVHIFGVIARVMDAFTVVKMSKFKGVIKVSVNAQMDFFVRERYPKGPNF